MPNNKKNTNKRIKKLILVCGLSVIILIVSTYAWFIGLQDVNVTSFDVEIASTESLLLSLDGSKWSTEVAISKETLDDVSYEGHKNNWGGTGLFPVSTVGVVDTSASRLIMYEKASLTATPDSYGFISTAGGYRLMASRVNNYQEGNDEQNGYVVFDLFVKNSSGNQYIAELNEADEEAIYLTTNSTVKIATDGVANTGIENSVRVAFAQIGRVSGFTTDASTITGITCADTSTTTDSGTIPVVTGICRTAQIWEPNDTAHVSNAISYYQNACLKRTGEDLTKASSYMSGSNCGTVENGVAYDTYAVNRTIDSSDKVDIYDGWDYNTYESTVGEATCTGGTTPTTQAACDLAQGVWTEADGDTEAACNGYTKTYCTAIGGTYSADSSAELYAFPYFTDSMKFLTGTNRPAFMKLAPNSITKIRVYIYIEGQDIDNYDYASIGKKISVNFGFTKQRINEEDIDYAGPSLNVGVCSGGTVPTTKNECTAAYGTWNGSSCYGTTKAYCTTIGGTFTSSTSNNGTCAGGTVPSTKATCTVAHGIWDSSTETCVGTIREYCDAIGGTFTLNTSNNTENNATPNPETAGTCSGNTQQYCDAISGTYTAENGDTPASCTGGIVPTTESACTLAHGTWTAD